MSTVSDLNKHVFSYVEVLMLLNTQRYKNIRLKHTLPSSDVSPIIISSTVFKPFS